MKRGYLIVVGLVLAAALAGLIALGARVLARDRADLYADFAQERLHRLEQAALELGNDVEKIGDDLELAGNLAGPGGAAERLDRELHAIAAITREYLAFEVESPSGERLVQVVAPDVRPDLLVRDEASIDDTVKQARATPGVTKTSRPLADADDETAWHRVFARVTTGGVAVALVVDMRPLLDRLRLLGDATSSLLVLGAHGQPAPSSDPALADAVRGLGDAPGALPGLARLLEEVRAHHSASVVIGEGEARRLGLPAAAAVGVAVPVLVEDGEPWALALVASTVALRTQERTLVRRMLVGAGLAGALLVALSAYVIRNARRAATMHERLQQADRLAHLTDKAEKILDHIPSGVIALGGDRRVSAVNRWIAERLGRDVLGDDLRGAFPTAPADDVAVLTALLDDALASGEARARGRAELSLFGAPGSYELHAVPLARRVADVHALLVIEDLSDQRRLEDRLLHSEKLATAGQLAAGIAHEIGTPLNVVRGRAELAEARLGPDHPQTPGQRIIIEQIDHVSRMLGQLLDFVRPRPSSMQPVAPGDALAQVVELVSAEADKRKVAVGLDVAADLPSLRADPGHLQQVLVNLTVNALDACDAGGHVTLRARPVDGGAAVVLEVEDDGVGIPAASRAQVFDPFFTTKKRGKGTGLGLWVVAQLVRGHDADIEVRSEAGAGTTFRITWPVAGRAPTSSTGAA